MSPVSLEAESPQALGRLADDLAGILDATEPVDSPFDAAVRGRVSS